MLDAMGCCGNASSAHLDGQSAAARIANARQQVATLLGIDDARDLVFTSGATEANNLAIRGVIDAARRDGRAKPHVLASAIEHSSILAPLRRAAARGEIDFNEIPARDEGIVRVGCVERRIRPETVLVSVQGANNEIGTIQPIEAIGDLCASRGVLFHTDLCQSLGKVPFDPSKYDLASMSAHKLYGPTGVGALYARGPVFAWLEPQTLGGGQENGRRAGTLNLHGIPGFGAAADAMRRAWCEGTEGMRLRYLRDALFEELLASLADVRVNGAIDPPCWTAGYAVRGLRLPHNLNVTLLGADGKMFHALVRDRVSLSAGSACKALGGQRSHVLDAIGAPTDGAVMRVGLGANVSEREVAEAAKAIVEAARAAGARPKTLGRGLDADEAETLMRHGTMYGAPPSSASNAFDAVQDLRRLLGSRPEIASIGTGVTEQGPSLFVWTRDPEATRRAAPAFMGMLPVEVRAVPNALVTPSGEAETTITHGVRILGAPIGSTVTVGAWPGSAVPGMATPTFLIPSGVQGPQDVRIVTPVGEVRQWRGDVPIAGEFTLRFDEMATLTPPPAPPAAPRRFALPASQLGQSLPTKVVTPPIRLDGVPAGAQVLVNGVPCRR